MTGILNCRITAEIQFYDILQGFCTGRGTRTTSLEVKLLQQIMALREEVMYDIFLYLHKSYVALDRDRCFNILEDYGVGPQDLHLLRQYLARLTMVARAGGYSGTPSKGYHRVTQGDPRSPTTFNAVVDVFL